MNDKKKSPREVRFEREAKALQKNIEKRKKQVEEREVLKSQKNIPQESSDN